MSSVDNIVFHPIASNFKHVGVAMFGGGGIPLEPKLQVLVIVITHVGPYQVVNQMLSINSRVWK